MPQGHRTAMTWTRVSVKGQAEGDTGLLRQFDILCGMAETEAYEVLVSQFGAGRGADRVSYDA